MWLGGFEEAERRLGTADRASPRPEGEPVTTLVATYARASCGSDGAGSRRPAWRCPPRRALGSALGETCSRSTCRVQLIEAQVRMGKTAAAPRLSPN